MVTDVTVPLMIPVTFLDGFLPSVLHGYLLPVDIHHRVAIDTLVDDRHHVPVVGVLVYHLLQHIATAFGLLLEFLHKGIEGLVVRFLHRVGRIANQPGSIDDIRCVGHDVAYHITHLLHYGVLGGAHLGTYLVLYGGAIGHRMAFHIITDGSIQLFRGDLGTNRYGMFHIFLGGAVVDISLQLLDTLLVGRCGHLVTDISLGCGEVGAQLGKQFLVITNLHILSLVGIIHISLIDTDLYTNRHIIGFI